MGENALQGRLNDKVAIVTGGGRGIGAAFCEALASEGAKVVVADVIDGTAVAKRVADAGGRAIYQKLDVTSQMSVEAAAADTIREFGRIDILVNNAGLFAGLAKKPFREIDNEEWDRVMAVNVRGPFLCAKAVAPAMIERRSGKIINIASGTVFKGFASMLHYVASKGAVVAMTRSLARELGAYNICVNAVAPGLTMSEAVATDPEWTGAANAGTVSSRALKRNQVPADLIGTLTYLASNDSDFVTGQTIVVDGGSVMR
ncbi:MAG: SDR family NAD(P)-dependent oxidoreductase [Pseudomonadota bacterium]